MCMTAKENTKSLFNSLCPLCNAFLLNYIKLHFLLVSQSHILSKRKQKRNWWMWFACVCCLWFWKLQQIWLFLNWMSLFDMSVSSEKPADRLSGPSFVISPSLLRSVQATCFFWSKQFDLFCRESKTVLLKAGLLRCCFCFCYFVLFLLFQEE